ncbi:radical SAM protein [Helicobacter sp. MIT 05-5293]|uniref:radical SAM protein n=1 Tax=Helicobacter sp. MIT 05-5293 TaxID=1548149 RepID=UPI0010FCE452|nr:radical SAM protein [Helicobacter sp. MIT 05-5293]TLD82015.1 radical SAM protein [Helicobacter sp. MIT 05-5293]
MPNVLQKAYKECQRFKKRCKRYALTLLRIFFNSYHQHSKMPLSRAYLNELSNLVLITGQNCSLKCKNCANFSPYLAKTMPFYPYEEICQDLQAITEECRILHLGIQGGEFFLHPNALQILEYIANNPRIQQVTIATNATIIPKDSLLAIIKQSNKIAVRLSDYGEVNYKSAQKLESVLIAHDISHYTHRYAHGDSQWRDCGGKELTRLKDKVVQKIFEECIFGKYCLSMENGFISRCSRGVIAHLVQGFSLGANDGILVRPNAKRAFATYNAQTYAHYSSGGGDMNKNYLPSFDFPTLKRFLESPAPIEACYYCYGTSGKTIPPGVQLTPEEVKSIANANQS